MYTQSCINVAAGEEMPAAEVNEAVEILSLDIQRYTADADRQAGGITEQGVGVVARNEGVGAVQKGCLEPMTAPSTTFKYPMEMVKTFATTTIRGANGAVEEKDAERGDLPTKISIIQTEVSMISSVSITEIVILLAAEEKLGEAVRRTMSFAPTQDMSATNAEPQDLGQGVETALIASRQVNCVTALFRGQVDPDGDAGPGYRTRNVHTVPDALAGIRGMEETSLVKVKMREDEAEAVHLTCCLGKVPRTKRGPRRRIPTE